MLMLLCGKTECEVTPPIVNHYIASRMEEYRSRVVTSYGFILTTMRAEEIECEMTLLLRHYYITMMMDEERTRVVSSRLASLLL